MAEGFPARAAQAPSVTFPTRALVTLIACHAPPYLQLKEPKVSAFNTTVYKKVFHLSQRRCPLGLKLKAMTLHLQFIYLIGK